MAIIRIIVYNAQHKHLLKLIKYLIGLFLLLISYSICIAQVDSIALEEVLVFPEEEIYKQKLLPSSVITLTIDDVLKLPATFFDPARLAQKFAGIANTNDQNNSISIRGTNPDYLKYFMEGVEIVNPNHLSNAGTFSDQPTQNAGGVNILSAQLLNTTQLYKSNYPLMFSSALSGAMSMSLRPGSFQDNKHFAQAGLIGMEVGSEGPIGKNKKMSYLANYRYSTVGLLSAAGLDFGGETIAFQDLSFNISRLTKKGVIKLFGIGGASRNDFVGTLDPNALEENKDRFNIDFSNAMTAFGLSLSSKESESIRHNASVVFSALNTSRSSQTLIEININEPLFSSIYRTTEKLGMQYTMFYTTQKGNEFQIGSQFYYTQIYVDPNYRTPIQDRFWEANLFFEYKTNPSKIGQLSIGTRVKNTLLADKTNYQYNIEPKISYRYLLSATSKIIGTMGLYSQLDPHQIYYYDGFAPPSDVALSQSKSANFVLASENIFKNNLVVGVELFYHHLYDIPITQEGAWSTINQEYSLDQYVSSPFVPFPYEIKNDAFGKSYGLEINFEKKERNGLYYQTNATLFDSKYKDRKEDWLNTRYNGRFIINGIIGKSWTKNKSSKENIYGINASLNYAGGQRQRLIDESRSENTGRTIFIDSSGYDLKAADYFRIDLSLYVKTNINKFSGRLSLDIQNVLNRRNEGFAYYDPFLQRIERQQQLGILPVLNYRISF